MAVKARTSAPVPTTYSWTGGYAGLNAGYGFADTTTVNETDNPPLLVNIPNSQRTFSFKRSGAAAGAQFGYNWQFDRSWLVGLETDIDWTHIDGSTSTFFKFGGAFPGAFTASSKLEWLGTVRGRFGYVWNDRLLIFGSGGLAYGDTRLTGSIVNNFGAPLLLSVGGSPICANNSICYAVDQSRTSVGWAAGGGLEYAAWNNVTFKIEYLYVNLGNDTVTLGPTTAISGGPTGSATYKFSDNIANILRAGFNLKF
jgi:outer membrane immunogenic protein